MTNSINSAIEAGSLSSLTAIAADPPPHPKAKSANSIPPLTLYIARVPGSRDVFLTPMKPREKIVTAEDVQSSLYYIHISTAQDSQAVENPRRLSSANANASELQPISETSVARKPAPPPRSPLRRPPGGSPQPPYPTESEQSSLGGGLQRSSKSQIARKPVLSDITNSATLPHQPHSLPEIPRRPLPPPPKEQTYLDVQPPATSPGPASAPGPGSLTLIRRDPATSSQWNVASIHDPPVHEVSSAALLSPPVGLRVKKGGNPLYLDVTNPGYLQFLPRSRPQSRISTSTASSDETAPEGTFRRRLYMPGSRYADHTYGHKPTVPTDSLRPSDALPATLRNRNSIDGSMYPDLATPSMDRRSKGYSFTSPWDGHCEFHTSTSGRALKCRHYLPEQQGGTAEVSELRFNLPTSVRTSQTSTPKAEKRSSYFTGLHRRLRSEDSWGGGPSPDGNDELPSYVFDEDGNLDLSLGQERAGGGFGGKQAKLGKLIIYPEGVGMLDLLVAANIGLWWRAWERV